MFVITINNMCMCHNGRESVLNNECLEGEGVCS